MSILVVIQLTLALLVCNVVYCARHIRADWRHSRRAEVTWGALALFSALVAVAAMVWATAASLAHLYMAA